MENLLKELLTNWKLTVLIVVIVLLVWTLIRRRRVTDRWQFQGALKNPKTGEVRAWFKLKGVNDVHAVVKLFRTDDEYNSVKIWKGDFNKTRSYWKTQVPVSDPFLYKKEAEDILSRVLRY